MPEEYAQYCDHGGLSNFDYAPLAEMMGRVIWSPENSITKIVSAGKLQGPA